MRVRSFLAIPYLSFGSLTACIAIFRRLLPYANKRNLRLVLLNMRDYPGSSPFTPEEVAGMASKDVQEQAGVIREMGRQIATFLAYFIHKYDIPTPRITRGKKNGGLSLLTWSLSNTMSMSLLGNAHTLPKKTKEVLDQYWHTLVMYGKSSALV